MDGSAKTPDAALTARSRAARATIFRRMSKRRRRSIAVMDVDVAATASAIGDPARVAMLDALLDGVPRSAGALAREAGVAPSTASHHLGRLVDAGLVTAAPDGRRRAFHLARPEVAHALEALALVSPPRAPRTLRRATRAEAERAARTCYDHLAGALGVALCDALLAGGALARDGDDAYALGPAAANAFGAIGVTPPAPTRRAYARPCLDWSERRPHLAGALGAAVAESLLARRWVTRVPRTRAVRVTDAGREGLRGALGVDA
jgi:DNA-binding transcriptional ArsR family regulator